MISDLKMKIKQLFCRHSFSFQEYENYSYSFAMIGMKQEKIGTFIFGFKKTCDHCGKVVTGNEFDELPTLLPND